MTIHAATDNDTPAWERQPGESPRAFAAFCSYRDQPPSTRKRDRNGKIADWCARWNWVARSLAWDEEQDRQRREAMIESAKVMAERQMRAAQLAQNKIVQWLIDLDPATLSPHEAARWYEVACRVERAAVGEPDRVDVTTREGAPVGELSAEETITRLRRARDQIDRVLAREP